MTPQICSIAVNVLFEMLPIAIALRLLRISVKFSPVLNDLSSIARAVPRP
jgi:hypothetical protein